MRIMSGDAAETAAGISDIWSERMGLFLHYFTVHYFQGISLALLIGYVADLILGDPHGMWHPVCLIGNVISRLEKRIRKQMPDTDRGAFAGGVWLVILVLFFSAGLPLAILMLGYFLNPWLGFAIQCYMCYTILAVKSLKTESMKVAYALERDGLPAGRRAVSMIVGRDTERLDEAGVIRAAVETVAENTSDGVLAPMLCMAVGGPVLGYFYKGANTMDSMVGYQNEIYRYFGRAAARFDDFMNYLPSRISAVLMILACFLMKKETVFLPEGRKGESRGGGVIIMDGIRAARIWKRDRRNHASPNSAQTESVMAGALGVQLAGDAWYFGQKKEKPTIGENLRPVERQDIVRADRLLYVSAALGLAGCLAIRFFLALVLKIVV